MSKKTSPLTKAQLLDVIGSLRKELKQLKELKTESKEQKKSASVTSNSFSLTVNSYLSHSLGANSSL